MTLTKNPPIDQKAAILAKVYLRILGWDPIEKSEYDEETPYSESCNAKQEHVGNESLDNPEQSKGPG